MNFLFRKGGIFLNFRSPLYYRADISSRWRAQYKFVRNYTSYIDFSRRSHHNLVVLFISKLYESKFMKFLFDLFPVILFFIAFKLYGIYAATAVAIAATFMQIIWTWFRHHKIEKMPLKFCKTAKRLQLQPSHFPNTKNGFFDNSA